MWLSALLVGSEAIGGIPVRGGGSFADGGRNTPRGGSDRPITEPRGARDSPGGRGSASTARCCTAMGALVCIGLIQRGCSGLPRPDSPAGNVFIPGGYGSLLIRLSSPGPGLGPGPALGPWRLMEAVAGVLDLQSMHAGENPGEGKKEGGDDQEWNATREKENRDVAGHVARLPSI